MLMTTAMNGLTTGLNAPTNRLAVPGEKSRRSRFIKLCSVCSALNGKYLIAGLHSTSVTISSAIKDWAEKCCPFPSWCVSCLAQQLASKAIGFSAHHYSRLRLHLTMRPVHYENCVIKAITLDYEKLKQTVYGYGSHRSMERGRPTLGLFSPYFYKADTCILCGMGPRPWSTSSYFGPILTPPS